MPLPRVQTRIGNKPNPRTPRHWEHRTVKLVVFGVFCGIVLTGAEFAARLVAACSSNESLQIVLRNYGLIAHGQESNFRFMPDNVLPYRLTPGFQITSSDGVSVTRHNRAGFRDNAEFGPKTAETLRIVCIGGSVTYGAGVQDNNNTYPACLFRSLDDIVKIGPWKHVEVFNLGVGGYTSVEDAVNLQLYGLPLKPDVVLIHSGVNDVAPRFYPNFRCDYSHFRKPMKPLAAGTLRRLLWRSRLVLVLGWGMGLIEPPTLMSRTQQPLPAAGEALANLAANGPECFRDHVREMIELCRQYGVQVWVLTSPYLNALDFEGPTEDIRRLDEFGYQKGLQEHNDILRELARTYKVGLIDLDQTVPPKRALYTDPIHFSDRGNSVAAGLIAETLVKSLDQKDAPASAKEMSEAGVVDASR